MKNNGGRLRHQIVLVPCPFQGHITPMLQLGHILHSKGFSITVVHTQFNSPNPIHHPHFRFLSIPDGLSDQIIASGNILTILSLINVNCRAHFKQVLADQIGSEIVCCVIYDELMYFSEFAANQLNVSSIILRTTSAATCLGRVAFHRLKQQGLIPFQDSMLQSPVPDLQPFRFKDLPTPFSRNMEAFLALVHNAYSNRTSSAIIWNTMECLDEFSLAQIRQESHIPIFPIGPLHKIASSSSSTSLLKEDIGCIEWLDKQANNSVLYVSWGSVATADDQEIAEMAWGLVNSKQPFLWVVRPGLIRGSQWIEAFPEGLTEAVGERGCIVKWVPQKKVLGHGAVGGFLSHCGWNSVLESICEGIPMICKPNFGDQRVNARYVSHVWRIGLEMDDEMERGNIEIAVRRLMVEEEGLELRKNAKILKDKVEAGLQNGGPSSNSLNDLAAKIMSF